MYDMDDLMPFGKYKGQMIEDLLEDDPEYMKWAAEYTDIRFTDEVLERIEKI